MKYLFTRSCLGLLLLSFILPVSAQQEAPTIDLFKTLSSTENDVYAFVLALPNKEVLIGGSSTLTTLPYTSQATLVHLDSVGDTIYSGATDASYQSLFQTAAVLPNGNVLIGGTSNEAPLVSTPTATFFYYEPAFLQVTEAMSLANSNGAAPQEINAAFVGDQGQVEFLARSGGSSVLGAVSGDTVLGSPIGDTVVNVCQIFGLDPGERIATPDGGTLMVGKQGQNAVLLKLDSAGNQIFLKSYETIGGELNPTKLLIKDNQIIVLANIMEFGPTGVVNDLGVLQLDMSGNLIEIARLSRPAGVAFSGGAVVTDDSTIQANIIFAGSNGQQQSGQSRLNLNTYALTATAYNPPNLSMELRSLAQTPEGNFLAAGGTIDLFNNFAMGGVVMSTNSLGVSDVCVGAFSDNFTNNLITATVSDINLTVTKPNTFTLERYQPVFSPFAPTVENVAASISGTVTVQGLPMDTTTSKTMVELFEFKGDTVYTAASDRVATDNDGNFQIEGISSNQVHIRAVPGDTSSNVLTTYPDGNHTWKPVEAILLNGCEDKNVSFDIPEVSTQFIFPKNKITGMVTFGPGNPVFTEGTAVEGLTISLFDNETGVLLKTTLTAYIDDRYNRPAGSYTFDLLDDDSYTVAVAQPYIVEDTAHENIVLNAQNRIEENVDFLVIGQDRIAATGRELMPIDKPLLTQTFQVYPNPNQGGPVRFSRLLHEVRIFNMNGQTRF